MKSQLKRIIYQGIGFLVIIVLVASCSTSFPQGEIKAELIENGKLLKENLMALIWFEDSDPTDITVGDTDDEIRKAQIFVGSINESGILSAKDMPAGYYMLALVDPFLGTLNVVYQEDEIFIFELPEEHGVNLGVVDVSLTKPMSR